MKKLTGQVAGGSYVYLDDESCVCEVISIHILA